MATTPVPSWLVETGVGDVLSFEFPPVVEPSPICIKLEIERQTTLVQVAATLKAWHTRHWQRNRYYLPIEIASPTKNLLRCVECTGVTLHSKHERRCPENLHAAMQKQPQFDSDGNIVRRQKPGQGSRGCSNKKWEAVNVHIS